MISVPKAYEELSLKIYQRIRRFQYNYNSIEKILK